MTSPTQGVSEVRRLQAAHYAVGEESRGVPSDRVQSDEETQEDNDYIFIHCLQKDVLNNYEDCDSFNES